MNVLNQPLLRPVERRAPDLVPTDDLSEAGGQRLGIEWSNMVNRQRLGIQGEVWCELAVEPDLLLTERGWSRLGSGSPRYRCAGALSGSPENDRALAGHRFRT